MRNVKWFPVLFLVVSACATGQPQTPVSTSGGRAGVAVVLQSEVFFGSGTTAPAQLDVLVENRSAEPIVVRQIRVESFGMASWGVYPNQRTFKETINPGEAKAFQMFATASASSPRMRTTEPLSVRAVVHFDSGTERYQEIFTGPVSMSR